MKLTDLRSKAANMAELVGHDRCRSYCVAGFVFTVAVATLIWWWHLPSHPGKRVADRERPASNSRSSYLARALQEGATIRGQTTRLEVSYASIRDPNAWVDVGRVFLPASAVHFSTMMPREINGMIPREGKLRETLSFWFYVHVGGLQTLHLHIKSPKKSDFYAEIDGDSISKPKVRHWNRVDPTLADFWFSRQLDQGWHIMSLSNTRDVSTRDGFDTRVDVSMRDPGGDVNMPIVPSTISFSRLQIAN